MYISEQSLRQVELLQLPLVEMKSPLMALSKVDIFNLDKFLIKAEKNKKIIQIQFRLY